LHFPKNTQSAETIDHRISWSSSTTKHPRRPGNQWKATPAPDTDISLPIQKLYHFWLHSFPCFLAQNDSSYQKNKIK
jgi:hypothetical protein